jgi:hypothetical protein
MGIKRKYMNRTIQVLHEGGLALYTIDEEENGDFTAHLLQYNGNPALTPPQDLFVCKEGKLRKKEVNNQELLEDISYAIELSLLNNNLLFSPRKNQYE